MFGVLPIVTHNTHVQLWTEVAVHGFAVSMVLAMGYQLIIIANCLENLAGVTDLDSSSPLGNLRVDFRRR